MHLLLFTCPEDFQATLKQFLTSEQINCFLSNSDHTKGSDSGRFGVDTAQHGKIIDPFRFLRPGGEPCSD